MQNLMKLIWKKQKFIGTFYFFFSPPIKLCDKLFSRKKEMRYTNKDAFDLWSIILSTNENINVHIDWTKIE